MQKAEANADLNRLKAAVSKYCKVNFYRDKGACPKPDNRARRNVGRGPNVRRAQRAGRVKSAGDARLPLSSTKMSAKMHEQWTPPTPQSVFVAVAAPKLPPVSESFEPLPPSSLPRQEASPATDSGNEEQQYKYQRPRSESLAYLLNPEDDKHRAEGGVARATPSSINNAFHEAELTAPVFGYFNELQEAFRPAEAVQVRFAALENLCPAS